MKKLIIYTSGGLSNRVFPIASAIEFAKKTERELFVFWPIDRSCGAEFNHLYKDKLNFIGVDFLNSLEDQKTSYVSKFQDTVINDGNFYGRPFLISKLNKGLIKIGEISDDNESENIVYASNTFMENLSKEQNERSLKSLTIVEDCQQLIESLTNELGINRDVIGVHARGTDFLPDINFYIKRIELSIEHPNQKILICSDDSDLESSLINLFPNVIYRKNKSFVKKYRGWDVDRNEVSIMKDSIIDLFLLSKTNFKVYNQRSMFSSYIKILAGE